MSLPVTLNVGDCLTVFGKALAGDVDIVGVNSHGCCYPLYPVRPLSPGTEITLTDMLSGASDMAVAESADQAQILPLVTYKYGWVARSEGESYLWSRDGEQCRVNYTYHDKDRETDYRIADLKPGYYVRFIFIEGVIQPVIVCMTHDGPEEQPGLDIVLTGTS